MQVGAFWLAVRFRVKRVFRQAIELGMRLPIREGCCASSRYSRGSGHCRLALLPSAKAPDWDELMAEPRYRQAVGLLP